jgi:diguanylate cyclase (GGDEF)-like protein
VDLVAAERVAERVGHLLASIPARGDGTGGRRWLREVELLLPATGDEARARLLAARAAVRGEGAASGRRGAASGVQRDAIEAAELFERIGEPLAAATNYAVAATAAVRSGRIGPALETAVRALVAFDATPGGELGDGQAEDSRAEAHLAGMLGVLCHHFFDYPRALRFYELALTGSRGDGGAQRWSLAMRDIAEVLLAQARELDADPEAQGRLLDRAEELARRLIADGSPARARTFDGPRLLATVMCERQRPGQAWALLQGVRAATSTTAAISPTSTTSPTSPTRPGGSQPDDPGALGALHLATGRCLLLLDRPAEAVAELDAALALLGSELDLAARILALRLRSLARQQDGDVLGALADARRLADLLWNRHQRQVGGFMDQLWSRAGVEGERRDLEARTEALLRSAEQDPLTELANRRALERFCGQIRGDREVCLVLIDIDDFKQVNDRFGHAAGDWVLCEMAGLLTRSVRSVDVVARWGGEEFLIALPGGSGRLGSDAATRVCERVREHPWHQVATGLRVTVSAGVASGPVDDLDAVLRQADAAMYRAKRAGRDQVVTTAAH